MKIKKSLSLFIASAVLASCISLPSLASAAETAVKESTVKGMPTAKTVYTDDNFEDRTITDSTAVETPSAANKIAGTTKSNYKQEPSGNKYLHLAKWGKVKTQTADGQNIDKLTMAFKIANRTDSTEKIEVKAYLFGTYVFKFVVSKEANRIAIQEVNTTYATVATENRGEAVVNSDETTTYWHDVVVTLRREKNETSGEYTVYFDGLVLDGRVIEAFDKGAVVDIPLKSGSGWWNAVSGSKMIEVGNLGEAGVCIDNFAVYEPGVPDEVFVEKGLNFDVSIPGMPEGKLIYTDDTFNDRTITEESVTEKTTGDKKIMATDASYYKAEENGDKYVVLPKWGTIKSRTMNGQNIDKLTVAFSFANRTGSDIETYMRVSEVGYIWVLSYTNANSIKIREPGAWKYVTIDNKGKAVTNSDETVTYWHDVSVTMNRVKDEGADTYTAYYDEVVVDGVKCDVFNGLQVKNNKGNLCDWWSVTDPAVSIASLGNSGAAGICFDNFAVYVPGFTTHMYPNEAGGITVINRGNSAISGNIVFGFYQDGKLVDVIINPDTIAAAVDEKAEAPVLLSDVQYDTVKAFYWNAEKMLPLCPALAK